MIDTNCTIRHRWHVAVLGLLVFCLGMLLSPRTLYIGDPLIWILEARSIATSGSLSADTQKIPRNFLTPAGRYFVQNPHNGRFYSKYGIGSSLTVLPAVALTVSLGESFPSNTLVYLLNVQYAAMSATLAILLFCLARRIGCGALATWVFVLCTLYGTFLWQYLRAQTMELPICLFFTAWFLTMSHLRQAQQENRPTRALATWMVLTWAAVLMLVTIRPIFVLLLPITAVAMLLTAPKSQRLWRWPAILLPGLLIAAVVGLLNHIKFGAWYHTGYHAWEAAMHYPRLANLDHLYEAIVDPQFSLLITFPVFAIGLWATRELFRRQRADCLLAWLSLAVIGGAYLLTDNWRGEWAEGPRYFIFALPLLSLPFALIIQRLRDSLSHWNARLCAALIVLVIGWTACMQVLALSRPFGAYYQIGFPLNLFDINGQTMVTPRGLYLESLWRALSAGRDHPVLDLAQKRFDEAGLENYRRMIETQLRPTNFWYFQPEPPR